MKLADIIRRNRELGAELSGPTYRIALLSNIVFSSLKEPLELALREEGIRAEVVTGDYGTLVQDSERFAGQVDAVIIAWEACNLVEGFQDLAELMSADEVVALEQRVIAEFRLALQRLSATPLVLVNSFCSALFEANALGETALARTCRRLNASLAPALLPQQRLVDLPLVLARVGLDAAVDARTFQSARAPYTTAFAVEYAAAVLPAFRAVAGRARKVLALDCDNTLWGGILGEDTPAGLEMSTATTKGRSFHDAQVILRGLRERGVLLALCTKNNPDEVADVLAHHPDMVLKDSDFAATRVNWKDKAENLQSIAEQLNVGLDSFVFLDDSPFETGLVSTRLPLVKALQVSENISDYPGMLRHLGREFFTLTTTAEDRDRTAMYRAEERRRGVSAAFGSTEEYLASLQLTVAVQWGPQINVPRAAQLTQKTNQFNVTTRRYTEADIEAMVSDPTRLVGTGSVRDRYGDSGITGLIIAKQSEGSSTAWRVDTFLLSCRVIGRKIESALFDALIEQIASRGGRQLEAEFLLTPKNGQVAGLFDAFGMATISREARRTCYRLSVEDYQPSKPAFIQTVATADSL